MTTEPDRLEVMQADRRRAIYICRLTGWKGVAKRLEEGWEPEAGTSEANLLEALAAHRIETNSRTGDTADAELIADLRRMAKGQREGLHYEGSSVPEGFKFTAERAADRIESITPPEVGGEANPSIDGGKFDEWSMADFAAQCRMQAREQMDPEFSRFMAALANRIDRSSVSMLLYCPKCGLQHIDAPDEQTPEWTNPPHKSHLCHGCGCVWRPADFPTEGVASIETRGKADTWTPPLNYLTYPDAPAPQSPPEVGGGLERAMRAIYPLVKRFGRDFDEALTWQADHAGLRSGDLELAEKIVRAVITALSTPEVVDGTAGLVGALEKIAKNGIGAASDWSADECADYWARQTLTARGIARAALAQHRGVS